MRRMGIFVAGLIVLAACASSSSSDPPMAVSQALRDTAPDVAPADAIALRDGNAALAFDLQRALAKSDANLAFSPYSVSLALAMTYAGARGTTATEMATALHFTLPAAQLHPAFDAIDLAIASRGPVSIANSLWASPRISFEAPFLDTLATSYGAGVRLTDFDRPEEARSTINGWVSEQTHAKIAELIPDRVFDKSTRLVLVDAIYFKAAWQTPFPASGTGPGTFHGLHGDVSASMMHLPVTTLRHVKGEGFEAIALPYESGALSMLAIAPDDLAAFEATLDAAKWQQITSSMTDESVYLTMPKVKVDGASLSLSDALKARGMPTAFSPSDANFSAMTNAGLYIQEVFHQAFVAIDEQGSEAAAATAVIGAVDGSVSLAPPTTIPVVIDRPFVFAIRDDATGAILFLGHVVNPS